MKRATIILSALAASAALAGCSIGSTESSVTLPVVVERTETVETKTETGTSRDVYVTAYQWDEWGLLSNEKQTKNGLTPVYEISDYKLGSSPEGYMMETRKRVTRNADGTDTTTQLVYVYGQIWQYEPLVTLHEILDEDNNLIEKQTTDYSDGRTTSYKVTDGTGEIVKLLREDYIYGTTADNKKTQVFRETRYENGQQNYTRFGIKIMDTDLNGNILTYQIFANVPEEVSQINPWNGTDGDVIEEKYDYEEDTAGFYWKIAKYEAGSYDPDAPLSVTTVANKVSLMTFKR